MKQVDLNQVQHSSTFKQMSGELRAAFDNTASQVLKHVVD